jgi:hypothetical protein
MSKVGEHVKTIGIARTTEAGDDYLGDQNEQVSAEEYCVTSCMFYSKSLERDARSA